jgi:hypothetical protein
MSRLLNPKPDRIERLESGQYRFIFAAGRDINTLPIDAEYWIVYSPSVYCDQWHVVVFRILSGKRKPSYVGIAKERKLNTNEIAHFMGLLATYQEQ